VECVIIDTKVLPDFDKDFTITLSSEPWFYSSFWRRLTCSFLIVWVFIYFFSTRWAYYNYPKICKPDVTVEIIQEVQWTCEECGETNKYENEICSSCNEERPADI
jgi:hypothetical protein